jgi:hypothetical protein
LAALKLLLGKHPLHLIHELAGPVGGAGQITTLVLLLAEFIDQD